MDGGGYKTGEMEEEEEALLQLYWNCENMSKICIIHHKKINNLLKVFSILLMLTQSDIGYSAETGLLPCSRTIHLHTTSFFFLLMDTDCFFPDVECFTLRSWEGLCNH